MGGEDGEAGVVEPGERHQRVVLRALAADLVAVGAGGLVAVVAVGDQQLGAGEALDHRGDDGRVGDPPDAVDGAVGVGDLAPGLGREGGLDQRPGVLGREREDRREVQVRGPRQFEPVDERAGVGALVGADGAGLVVLDPDPDEDAVAGVRGAVGGDVVLRQRPDRILVVGDQHALGAPGVDPPRRVLVRIADRPARGILRIERLRQIDRHRVVGRAIQQPHPLGRVDHVIRRRGDPVEPPDLPEVVVQGSERFDVGHGPEAKSSAESAYTGHVGAWRSLVARCLWVAEVPGSTFVDPTPGLRPPVRGAAARGPQPTGLKTKPVITLGRSRSTSAACSHRWRRPRGPARSAPGGG